MTIPFVKITTALFVALIALLFPLVTQALPSISSVSGTFSEGNTITIQGSGFGANGPVIAIYDEFEKGAIDTSILTITGSATIGQWSTIHGACSGVPYLPTYESIYARSGIKSAYFDYTAPCAEPGPSLKLFFSPTNEMYLSYACYIEVGGVVPGGLNNVAPNWKQAWFNYPEPEAEYVTQTVLRSNPDDNRSSAHFLYNQGGIPPRVTVGDNWWGASMPTGQWSRFDYYFKGDNANGTLQARVTNANHGHIIKGTLSGKTLGTGSLWNKLNIPGYSRGNSPNGIYYDDIYLATGPGARARVELSDATTYSNSHNLAVGTVTSWSDTSLTFTFRKGSFSNGQQAYLFVIDGTGQPSAGYPIVVNDKGANVLSPPLNLRPM